MPLERGAHPAVAALVRQHADSRAELVKHHLGGRSKATYDSGVGCFCKFATEANLPTCFFSLSLGEIQAAIECFIVFMVNDGYKPSTITQYISHLAEYLKVRGIETTLRGEGCAVLLQCARRKDQQVQPLRLRQSIPISCALMVLVLARIDRSYPGDAHRAARLQIKACCAFAYGLCCRIHEVLFDGKKTDKDGFAIQDHAARSAHCAFQFAGSSKLYPANNPAAFPPNQRPISFAGFHDSLKNWAGGGPSRNVAANARVYPFCCPGLLYDYVVAYPPPANGHLFPGLKAATVSREIKPTLESVGLPGDRGCPHGMRIGSESMALAARHMAPAVSESQAQEHGLWRSAQGLRPYARSAFASGGELSAFLYDMNYMPIDYLQWYYTSPAIKVAINGEVE